MPIIKPNFFAFTGGPGAGKTTVIEELMRRGHYIVPEVARTIIQAQHAMGGNATHDGDRKTYCKLMLQDSVKDYLQQATQTQPVFFDRTIADLYSYANRFCGGVTSEIAEAVQEYRYNTRAFIFPAWPEIYQHDAERKQSFAEAVATYDAVKEGYQACGYQIIEVPKVSIAERVDFILQAIDSK